MGLSTPPLKVKQKIQSFWAFVNRSPQKNGANYHYQFPLQKVPYQVGRKHDSTTAPVQAKSDLKYPTGFLMACWSLESILTMATKTKKQTNLMLVEHGNALTLYLLYIFYTLQEIHKNTAIVRWPWNILIFPGNTIKTGVFFTKDFLCFFVKCWGQGSLRACRLYMPHFAKWKKDVESLPATCGSHCGRPKDVQKTNGSCWWPKMASYGFWRCQKHRFLLQTPRSLRGLFEKITSQGSFLQKDSL